MLESIFFLTRHGDSEELVACVRENNSDCPFMLMGCLLVTVSSMGCLLVTVYGVSAGDYFC